MSLKIKLILISLVLTANATAEAADLFPPSATTTPSVAAAPTTTSTPAAGGATTAASAGTGAGTGNGLSAGKPGEARKVEVDSLKKKYWEYNQGQPLTVIQNRTYTKAGRFNLGLSAGTVANDPFLTSYTYGLIGGYNFSEYLSASILYWKATNSPSSAATAFVNTVGYGVNSNPISSLIGGEVTWSVLYGKLSLLGMAIIHFDFYLFGGVGQLSTQNGNYITPWIGVGEQVFMTHSLTLSLDYRMLRYNENIVELYNPATLGQVVANKNTYAGAFTLGFNVFF
jgi:outer membrane beta-barrel protein